MVNVRDPKEEVDAFRKELDSLIDRHSKLEMRISKRTGFRDGHLDYLYEATLMRLVTEWESFLSAYAVAVVNKRSSAFVKVLKGMFGDRLKHAGLMDILDRRLFTQSWHPSVRDVEQILDQRGSNVEFPTRKEWIEFTAKHFEAIDAKKAAKLSPTDFLVIDAVTKLRHRLAHKSAQSQTDLDESLAVLAKAPGVSYLAPGAKSAKKLGAFLQVKVNGTVRLFEFAQYLRGCASKLR